jgi:hypothetical protein
MSEMPGRRSVEAILQWAPALEMPAYGAAASLSTMLDEERPRLFAKIPREERTAAASRRRYWELVNLMGRLTILSTEPEARSWLSEMANSFEWITWTPSWPLLRERSLWLAAIAARSAAAFGAGVTDRYLDTLGHARKPMKIFDALFGLTAVALGSPSHRDAILTEMHKSIAYLESQSALGEPTVRLAADQAIDILREPKAAENWSKSEIAGFGMQQSLFAPRILASDGAMPLKNVGHPAFAILPFALSAQILDFFPTFASAKAGLHLGLSKMDIKTLISSAWSSERPVGLATLH